MRTRDIIVVGASAGGLPPILEIVAALPCDLPAAIFFVMHRPTSSASQLDHILRRAGTLEVAFAADGERIRHERIYLAPADQHMVLENGRVRLTKGPKENRFRPAIDPLFRSAAYAYDSRVIGVILSGFLDDGTSGLWWIKDRGGIAIVQDPKSAAQPSMPESALDNVDVDHRLTPDAIPDVLIALARTPASKTKGRNMSRELETEVRIALEDKSLGAGVQELGETSEFTCPECHGVLIRVRTGKPQRYRCHTGHAYSRESLLESLNESVEQSVWNTIRDIEERLRYLELLAQNARAAGDAKLAAKYTRQAKGDRRRADAIRDIAKA